MRKIFNHKWFFLATITIVGFILDWVSKYMAVIYLENRATPVRIIGDYAQLMLVYNTKAIFGFDPNRYISFFPTRFFFSFFSIVAIVILLFYYRNVKKEDTFVRWGLALVLPGAIGNLADRIFYPDRGVVDFIKLGISETIYWPIFNLADVFITFGVIILLISVFLEERQKRLAMQCKDREKTNNSSNP